MDVGFVGLGSQGGPMARRIVAAGIPTTLYARRPDALAPFGGAAVAASPAELAAASDVLCICVVDDEGVTEVIGSALPGLRAGAVVVVHSTVHPDTCRRLAERVGGRGARLVDAPVSGGGQAAAEGRLLVMAGGDAGDIEHCRPVFESYAGRVVHLGGVGAGQVAKLVNNLLFTAHLGTASAALQLASSLGLDATALAGVLADGSAASFALDVVARAGGSAAPMGALAGDLLQKDVRLVVDLAGGPEHVPGGVLGPADAALDLMRKER